jgi:hypothetical protein
VSRPDMVLPLVLSLACIGMGCYIAALAGRANRTPGVGVGMVLGGICGAVYWALRLAGA